MDKTYIIKEVNDDELKVISGMDNKVSIEGDILSYILIGVANCKDTETELWEKRDFYEDRSIDKKAISEMGLQWLHKQEQWQIAISIIGSNEDIGFRFAPEDQEYAKTVYSGLKNWWLNG